MVSHFDADCKERIQLKRPRSGFRSPTARMNVKPRARVCFDLIFLCSAVGILVHHVLHIWETQLSEGRRSPDHWEVLFLGGRHLGAFVPSRSISSAINRFIWPSSAMPPRILAAAISAFADSAHENNRCHWLPRFALLSRLPWFPFRARRRLQCQGQPPTRCEGTIHPRGDLRQTLEPHAVSGPSIR